MAPPMYRFARACAAALALALAAAGCAGAPAQPPASGYVPDSSYHLLMAEIALQRGVHLDAAQEYLTAAEQSVDSELARRATEYAFDYGYDRFALRAAQRWLELEPDSTLAHEYLGRLELRRYDALASARHFAETLDPPEARTGDDFLALEAELASEPNALGVLRVVQLLGAGAPDSPGYRLALARAAYRAGRLELAIASALEATTGRDAFQAEVLASRALLARGDMRGALGRMAALVRTQPIFEAELEYVRLLLSAGLRESAREALGRLIARDGPEPELLRLRALLALEDQDLGAAGRDLDRLVEQGSEVYEAFYFLGEISAEEGYYEDGIRYFERIGAGPYLLPAQLRIADLLRQLGRPDDAVAHLVEFGDAYPRYAFELTEARARQQLAIGDDAAALASYSEALAYQPWNPGLRMARGMLLDRLGRPDAALADFEFAVRTAPESAEAQNTYGYTLATRTRRFRDAYRHVRIALELAPGSAAILDSMGWVLYRLGRDAEALSYLEQAFAALPDPEVAAHLGEVLWHTGERERARRILESALADHPDSPPLTETAARLLGT